MEASALPVPAARGRIFISAKLLRLRSDEQLVALFRSGSDEAFQAIHERYRQRLFAYIRQMLIGPRQDAEDALQDVFVRAYSALRLDDRPVSLRAWLYRIAHNRCIDQLRRPAPIPTEMVDLNFESLQDPLAESERSQKLRELVADVQRLPDQQRSALLMRELQGMSYADLAVALEVSVAAVKSLLLRARTSLIEASIARDTSCNEIQADLVYAHDHGERIPSRARRHLRECAYCDEYRTRLRSIDRSFAALAPAGLGVGLIAKLFGGSGAAAGGAGASGSIAGGGTIVGGAATVTAGKVAALVCCAALVTAGVAQKAVHSSPAPHRAHHPRAAAVPRTSSATVSARSEAYEAQRTGGTVAYSRRAYGAAGSHTGYRTHHHAAAQPLTGQDYPSYPDVQLPAAANHDTVAPAPQTQAPQSTQNPIAKLLNPGGSSHPSGSSTGSGSSSATGGSTSGSGASSSGSSTGSGSGSSTSPPSSTGTSSGTSSH